jgi:hypothetical protein
METWNISPIILGRERVIFIPCWDSVIRITDSWDLVTRGLSHHVVYALFITGVLFNPFLGFPVTLMAVVPRL